MQINRRTAAYVLVNAVVIALVTGTSAHARFYRRPPKPAHPPPIIVDPRDRIVAAGPFRGAPYWLALARCGGIYFKINKLYTAAAVRARVLTHDRHANVEDTKELNVAIDFTTIYYDAAERFLMTDRRINRDDAVLTFDGPAQAAGEQVYTIGAAHAAAKACPALYRSCEKAYPKACSLKLAPFSRAALGLFP